MRHWIVSLFHPIDFEDFDVLSLKLSERNTHSELSERASVIGYSRISSSLLESEHDQFGSKVSYILLLLSGQWENKVFYPLMSLFAEFCETRYLAKIDLKAPQHQ